MRIELASIPTALTAAQLSDRCRFAYGARHPAPVSSAVHAFERFQEGVAASATEITMTRSLTDVVTYAHFSLQLST